MDSAFNLVQVMDSFRGFGLGGLGILYSISTVSGLALQVENRNNGVSIEPPPVLTTRTRNIQSALFLTPSPKYDNTTRSISPISISRSCVGGSFIKGNKHGFCTLPLSPSLSPSPSPEPLPEPIRRPDCKLSTRRWRVDFSISPPFSPRVCSYDDFDADVDSTVEFASPPPSQIESAACSEVDQFVGDCNVCYDPLPLRSNHIFTVCGHLFCVKCLFRWGIQTPNCPLCREKLYQEDEDGDGEMDDADYHDNGGAGAGAGAGAIDQELVDNNNINNWNNNNYNWNNDNINNDVYAEHAWRDLVPRIDSYIHDDEEIEWTGSVDMDDHEVPTISRGEIEELREARVVAISMISRHLYQTLLITNIEITGGIIHTFIPRAEYMEINNNDIGRGGNFYEFVLCRRSLPQSEPCSEMNLFGYITEIKVVEVRNAHLQENQSWENTHEYCFVVEVFDSLWTNGTPVDAEGIIDLTECQQMTLRFADVRRVYSVWTMTRVQS